MKLKTELLIVIIALAGTAQSHAARIHRDAGLQGRPINTVFVIALENHNWTQPSSQGGPQPIFQDPAAPFINSLVNGTSGISGQVAYAKAYLNAAAGIHPSEPNYLWAEAGTNFGVSNDHDPYALDCTPDTVQFTHQHLSAFLADANRTWRSYQEDANVDATNTPLPMSVWRVPLYSRHGYLSAPGLNPYNYSNQYDYAAKHNPMLFFADTNGGCDTSTGNPMRLEYAPLQQLAIDLAANTVADYNWISPDQYNDMHSSLDGGFGQYPKGDSARIAAADNFLARLVPLIMASDAYQNGGMIILWWDESEGGDDASHTMPFIIISKDVHENVDGLPYANTIRYSHSSFLRTMQEIFDVDPPHGYPWLGAAADATDLSDLLAPGALMNLRSLPLP